MRLLEEEAERQPAPSLDLATIGLVESRRDPQERGLARAVWADEADPVPSATAASMSSRMTSVPISRRTPDSLRMDT